MKSIEEIICLIIGGVNYNKQDFYKGLQINILLAEKEKKLIENNLKILQAKKFKFYQIKKKNELKRQILEMLIAKKEILYKLHSFNQMKQGFIDAGIMFKLQNLKVQDQNQNDLRKRFN